MRRIALLWPALLLAGACDDPGCEAAEALEPGTMSGTLDEEPWTGPDAQWLTSETGVQVSTAPGDDDWRVTFVAQRTVDGDEVARKTRGGGLPVEVTLLTGVEGGWATLNRGSADTYATENAEGGLLRLSRKGSGDLFGCAAFEARDGPRRVTATLAFRALASDLEQGQ